MNWNAIDNFAGGLARGIENGMRLYDLYETAEDRKKERQRERDIQASMQAAYASDLPLGAAGAVPAQRQSPEGHAVQAFPISDTPPAQPPQPIHYGAQTGLQTMLTPPATQSAMNRAVPNQPQNQQAPDEGAQYLKSVTAGIRAALRHGDVGKAQALFQQREQFSSAYDGKRKQDALNSAMTRFQASGNPNALVPYVNEFISGTQEYTHVTRVPDTGDGQPMYVVHGIDHTNGQPFSNPLSHTQLMQMAHAVADPSIHQKLAVQEWQTLDALKREKGKASIQTDAALREFDHKAPVEQQNALARINAQGDQTRRNQDNAARHDKTGAAPAEIRTAEWLIGQGIASDPDIAWQMVRSLKTQTREQFIQNTTAQLLKGNDNPMIGEKLTPQQAVQQAAEIYNAIQKAVGTPGKQSYGTDDLDDDTADAVTPDRMDRARQLLRGAAQTNQRAAPSPKPESGLSREEKLTNYPPRVF